MAFEFGCKYPVDGPSGHLFRDVGVLSRHSSATALCAGNVRTKNRGRLTSHGSTVAEVVDFRSSP
jgi:hypothetical protein